MRLVRLVLALFAFVFAPAAVAQDEEFDDEPVIEEELPIDEEDPVDEEEVDDYYEIPPCGQDYYAIGGGDYYYCAPYSVPSGGGDEEQVDKRIDKVKKSPPPVPPPPVDEVQPLPASLPLTGGSPLVIALFGLALVFTGAGGRLLLLARE